MNPHRLALLLLLSLTQACIFSEISPEPDARLDMASGDMTQGMDMGAADSSPDLAAPDQDAPDLDPPDLDVPDQTICPNANCVTSCINNVLHSCEVDANGCVISAQTPCDDALCDAAANTCRANPCGGVLQILCDQAQPTQYIICEESEGVIVPKVFPCSQDQTICSASTDPNAAPCVPFECKEAGQRSCVSPQLQGICTLSTTTDVLYINEEKCGEDEICDGDRCRKHQCNTADLGTSRCTDSFEGEESCVTNANDRRVWATTQTCGTGRACSESLQRCAAHQCLEDRLNTTYCDGSLGGDVVSCSQDGGRRVKTVIDDCIIPQSCRTPTSGATCSL